MEKVLVGKPADKIVGTAKKLNVDMIVLGFVGLKGSEGLASSGASGGQFRKKSTVPVTIVPL